MGEIRVKTADGWSTKPAHKKTSTGWQDIPTHTMTANGWQGELTSQSPLKFRADGEMLDWRIEGKTSENLFDTSVYTNDTYIHNCTVTNTSTSVMITSTGTDPFVGFVNSPGATVPERAQLMYIPVNPNTTYTINMSSAPKCYCTQVDESDVIKKGTQINRLPYVFTTDSATRYIIMRLGDDTLQAGNSITFENIQLLEGTYTASTIPPYEPYGGVGDWDETEQKYRIPVRVEGENLVESVTVSHNQAIYGVPLFLEAELKPDTEYTFVFQLTEGYYVYWNEYVFTNNTPFVTGAGDNVLVVTKRTRSDLSKNDLRQYNDSKGGWIIHKNRKEEDFPASYNNVRLYEGTYTSSTIPPYEVSIFTDHQLMNGDSIDYTTTETTIPLATGNNTLMVDTAVKPKSVFVKFEG